MKTLTKPRMKQEKLFNDKVEFTNVESVIGSGYEPDFARSNRAGNTTRD